VIYPANLPLPDFGSYGGIIANGLVRTGFANPAPSQIETFNSAAIQISMTFSMDDSTYDEWLAWVIVNGYDFFDMPVVSPHMPLKITSTSRIRFISDLQMSNRSYNWQSVTVSGELIPNDDSVPPSLSISYPNFIQAGTPAAPSTDLIVAGTPSSPSVELIAGGMYVYDTV
jgi:hypothetical protein